jgi:hypothetical protein
MALLVLQERLGSIVFQHPARPKDEDFVAISDRRQPVCYDEQRDVLEVSDSCLYQSISSVVDRG